MRAKQFLTTAKNKGIYLGNHVVQHWKVPPVGNEVSYKEITNFSIGGMGYHTVMYMIAYMALNVSSVFLGSTIGIRPMHIQYISMAVTLVNVAFIFFRSYIYDNSRMKMGKFKPLIIIGSIPVVVMTAVFYMLNFDVMRYNEKLVWLIVFVLSIEFFKPFMVDGFYGMSQVITSNTNERTNVMTIYSILYSLSPTILNLFVPMLSTFTGGMTEIETYRYIMIPIGIFGVAITFFAIFGAKERLVTPKNYVQKVNILAGMKSVYKNKYWWIRNCAGWIGFLEGASGSVLMWMFIYGTQDMIAYGTVTMLLGEAATIAMVLTPFLLRRIGNKNMLVMHNAMNIVLLTGMMLTFRIPVLFVMFLFANMLFNYFTVIYNPVIDAEIRDYQHYITGKRMDGVFGAAGSLINTPIVLLTGLVVPFAYECFGMTTFDVLYDPEIRESMFNVLLIMSIFGAVLNLVPFLFYDYHREMHVNIVRVINFRAMIGDYSDECLSAERIKRGVDDYREVQEIIANEPEDIDTVKAEVKAVKLELKALKSDKALDAIDKDVMVSDLSARLKIVKARLRDAIVQHTEKKYVVIYVDELNKFDKDENKIKLAIAHAACDERILAFSKRTPEELTEKIQLAVEEFVKAENIELVDKNLKVYNTQVRLLLNCLRRMGKAYGDNFARLTMDNLNIALELPTGTRELEKIRYSAVRTESKIWRQYTSIIEHYRETKVIIKQKLAMENFAEIESMYDQAIIDIDIKTGEDVDAEKERKRIKQEEADAVESTKLDTMNDEKREKYLEQKLKRQERAERINKAIKEAVATESANSIARKLAKVEAKAKSRLEAGSGNTASDGDTTDTTGAEHTVDEEVQDEK